MTRNIQYTNVCYFRCGFCAFSKGKLAANLRGAPYLVPLDEIVRRIEEAWERGATEVCLQGGIHPAFTGDYYADVVRAISDAVPGIHVHAFSALEIWQGAATLELSLARVPRAAPRSRPRLAAGNRCRGAGRRGAAGHLPGQGDDVTVARRPRHGPSRRSPLERDLMFGHVDTSRSWARHLVRAREQQQRSGGFTEFVPLPFVPMEAPIYLQGRARRGPTFRETLLVHAVARLALHPEITNVQASWVKLGPDGTRQALAAGVNDLGGTLMNESISRSAGAGLRAGAAAGANGGADPVGRPRPAPAHDALRGRARRAATRLVRRGAARPSRRTRP